MKKTGFYIIKDFFFEDMDEPYLKGNKEGNRSHYYCLMIQFPITDKYIEREYTIAGNHLMCTSSYYSLINCTTDLRIWRRRHL